MLSFIDGTAALMAGARRELGDGDFDAAWAAGETLDTAGALGYALDVIASTGPSS